MTVRLKKRICLVVASPLSIRFYLTGYIAILATKYDLTVITNTDNPDFLAHLGVPVTVIPVRMERNVSLWRDLNALVQLVRIFYREKFDIVHSHSPKSGLLGMAAAWIVKVPVRIHTFHGEVWVTRTGWWRSFLKFLDKLVAKWATHLLVVSFSERKFLIEQGIASSGKLQVVANGSICGVDTVRFKPDPIARNNIRTSLGILESDTVILYLGRQTEDKGLLDLTDAFSRISEGDQHLHLLSVGPDEDDMQAKMQARCRNAGARLHFVDFTSVPEHYMAASDLLCLPSYREGFGLVLIEAAATGLATVGSRIHGITDAIKESETGLLFTARDVDDLTQKLQRLIADPALRHSLGEKGRERSCRDFSRERVLAEVLKYHEGVLPL